MVSFWHVSNAPFTISDLKTITSTYLVLSDKTIFNEPSNPNLQPSIKLGNEILPSFFVIQPQQQPQDLIYYRKRKSIKPFTRKVGQRYINKIPGSFPSKLDEMLPSCFGVFSIAATRKC